MSASMTGSHLAFEPILPWPLIAGLAGLLVVVLALLAWQRVRGVWWRALASALIVLALTNPVLQREEREGLPGIVALVVDESASQRLGDRAAQTEAAVAALKERLQALGNFEIREVHAADRPDGDGTALVLRADRPRRRRAARADGRRDFHHRRHRRRRAGGCRRRSASMRRCMR